MSTISQLGNLKIYKSYMLLATSCKLMFSGQKLAASSLKLVAIDLKPSFYNSARIN